MSDDDFTGNQLPPFPVDEGTLDPMWAAMHPRETNPDAERSSLGDFLTMMDRLGGPTLQPSRGWSMTAPTVARRFR